MRKRPRSDAACDAGPHRGRERLGVGIDADPLDRPLFEIDGDRDPGDIGQSLATCLQVVTRPISDPRQQTSAARRTDGFLDRGKFSVGGGSSAPIDLLRIARPRVHLVCGRAVLDALFLDDHTLHDVGGLHTRTSSEKHTDTESDEGRRYPGRSLVEFGGLQNTARISATTPPIAKSPRPEYASHRSMVDPWPPRVAMRSLTRSE